MATTKIKCCGELHEIIQFTYKGPIQYGVECSVCGKRVAGETPEALRDKWNPKPLDAGLEERLWKIWYKARFFKSPPFRLASTSDEMQFSFESVADYVRKIVKEAKEGK